MTQLIYVILYLITLVLLAFEFIFSIIKPTKDLLLIQYIFGDILVQ